MSNFMSGSEYIFLISRGNVDKNRTFRVYFHYTNMTIGINLYQTNYILLHPMIDFYFFETYIYIFITTMC